MKLRRANPPLPYAVEIGQEIKKLRIALGMTHDDFVDYFDAIFKRHRAISVRELKNYEEGLVACVTPILLQQFKALAISTDVPFCVQSSWLPRAAQRRIRKYVDESGCLTAGKEYDKYFRANPLKITPQRQQGVSHIVEMPTGIFLDADKSAKNVSKLRRYNPDLEETVLRAKARKIYQDTGSIGEVSRKLDITRYRAEKLVSGVVFVDPRIEVARKIYRETCNLRETMRRLKTEGMRVSFPTLVAWVEDIKCVRSKLSEVCSELELDWDPTNDKDFFSLPPGSDYMAKWICHKCGHDWVAKVYNRCVGRHRCPKCAGKLVDVSLAEACPELELDWDPTNDKDLHSLSPGARYMAKWICHKCGHPWKARVSSRCRKRYGCPKCSGKRLGMTIAEVCPELELDWDPTNDRDFNSLSPGASYEAKWICHKCGHNWKTKVNTRCRRKIGCRKCSYKSRQKSGRELRRYNPDLEKTVMRAKAQKIYQDTGNISEVSKKLGISPYIAKKLVSEVDFVDPRIAKARKIYQETHNLNETRRQLKAKGMGISYPTLAAWIEDIKFDFVDPRIAKARKIYQETHSLIETMRQLRAEGVGISYPTLTAWVEDIKYVRPRFELSEACPELELDWDPTNDRDFHSLSSGSDYWAKWICHKCGHSWKAKVGNRCKKRTRCPKCAGKLVGATVTEACPELELDWDPANAKDFHSLSPGASYMAKWICHKCGNNWEAAVNSRCRRKTGCRKCRKGGRKGARGKPGPRSKVVT